MSVILRALNEFENEDEDGKARLIYAYFGLALYRAQCIEQEIINMIWLNRIFKNRVQNQNEIDEIIDSIENSRMTILPPLRVTRSISPSPFSRCSKLRTPKATVTASK